MRYHNQTDALSVPNKSTIYETSDGSKEAINLLTLIAELFNAQVVSAKIIYDLIRGFLEAPAPAGEIMGEKQVEGLLRMIKCERRDLDKLNRQVLGHSYVAKTRRALKISSISYKKRPRARKRK